MALNRFYKKTVEVKDGDEVVGTVRGLSFNEIVQLIDMNRPIVEALFEKFNGVDPTAIAEDAILESGMDLIKETPVFAAQVIAAATDAYEGFEQTEGEVAPLDAVMAMPAGLQLAFLQEIGPLTFNAGGGAKKMLALAMKTVQGGSQSAA